MRAESQGFAGAAKNANGPERRMLRYEAEYGGYPSHAQALPPCRAGGGSPVSLLDAFPGWVAAAVRAVSGLRGSSRSMTVQTALRIWRINGERERGIKGTVEVSNGGNL